MRRQVRQGRRLVSTLCALALLAVACSAGESDNESTTTSGTEGGGDGSLSGTVRVWQLQHPPFNDALAALAEQYMQENPEVTVEFEAFDYDTYIQTLQTALPAGTEADILQLFGTWTCSYADNLAVVPDGVMPLATAEEAYFEAPLDGYVCDDTLYGFPQEFNIEYGATLVNTDLAAAAGLSDITDGWASWDEFTADAAALTVSEGDVITRAGYNFTATDALPFSFFSLILQAGGDYYGSDGQFTINTPEGRQALELLVSLVEAGAVDPVLFNGESNWVGDSYFEQTSAMGLIGPWVVAEYTADFPDVAAVTEYVPLPALDGNQAFVADSGWGLTVSSSSEVSDLAWDFASYVAVNPGNALGWNIASGTLPALRENVEGAALDELLTGFPHFEAWLELLPHGRYIGDLPDRDLLWYDIAYTHILNTLQGVESIDEALAAMEAEANETTG